MDTLLIKIAQPRKVNYLIQILKSLDFVISVDYFDKYVKAKKLFDEINAESSKKGLYRMRDEEIKKSIKSYRSGK